MENLYHTVFNRLPHWLSRRIFPLDEAVLQLVREAAESRALPVLDAGAGEARFRSLFQQPYFACDLGVGDSSWDFSKIDLLAKLEQLPFRDNSFGAVVNTQVLEHVPDPATVVRQLFRVLKPGGMLYLSAPQGWHEHQQPHDFFRFTRYSLEMLLTEAGFRNCAIQPMGGYFHYLGHRLTFIPKVLFFHRKGWLRALLLPLEAATVAACCFLAPIACFYLDALDRNQEFTLCYRCTAQKPPALRSPE